MKLSRSSEEITAIFQELYSMGNTIIVVTHERSIAGYTRRVVRFRDGSVKKDEVVFN